jgi:nucleoside-diphosphate-sugar epimerase
VNPISEESGNVSEISDFYALTKSMLENIILHNHALKNRTMVARFGIVLSSKREHLTLIEYVCKKFSTNDKSLKIKSKKIGRAYILLYDLVEMLEMSIFEHHSGIYNLGGAEFFSVEDVRCLSEKLLGRRLTLSEEDPGLVNYRNMNSKKFFEKYKYRPRGSESIVKVLINDFGGKIVE